LTISIAKTSINERFFFFFFGVFLKLFFGFSIILKNQNG
jgi:hypothetical protein